MDALERNYEVTRGDLTKDKLLKTGSWLAPVLMSVVPAVILFGAFLAFDAIPLFFFSIIALVVGFLLGLVVTGILLYRRRKWHAEIRERIAVDGIRAEEVGWFQNELTTAEKRALKEIESSNRLLADAYRETLASRLTATRILKTTRSELVLVQRRQNKLKYLKSESSNELQNDLKRDQEKLQEIKNEAEQMRVEAETRLQMIEAASRRGTSLSGSEIALKKLNARASELPLALEALKMEEELRREMESEEEELEGNK